MNIAQTLHEWWALLLLIASSIGNAISWYIRWKKDRKESLRDDRKTIDELYETLDLVQKKLIEKTVNEVRLTDNATKKDIFLVRMKNNCTNCYEKVLKELNPVVNE